MTENVGEFVYNKRDLIGHGAFAVVFKGHHRKKEDFVVAIKVIAKKNLSKSQNLLAKEIKILKELHHENVVSLFDCQEAPNSVFLVMEHCNGGDLADYLREKGTLSEDTIHIFLRQIASAMCALQSKGVVHRDLKPQNLLLHHTGTTTPTPSEIKIKIADFGFARFLPGEMMAATLCGSPMYMAPEVIMSKAYDAKADLWSVGTIIYQCLTGKAPFQANSPQALKKFYEKNKQVCPNIPAGTSHDLKDLLLGLLRRNPRERMDFGEFFAHPFLTGRPHRTSTPVAVPNRHRKHSGSPQGIRSPSYSPNFGAEALGDIREDLLRRMTPPYDTTSPQDPPTFIDISSSGNNCGTQLSSQGFCSPNSTTIAQDDELAAEGFVIVPSSPDVPGSRLQRKSSDPLFPFYSHSPPRTTGPPLQSPSGSRTPQRAMFTVGSSYSSSPTSPPSRRSPSYVSPAPSPSSAESSPIEAASRRRRQNGSPGLALGHQPSSSPLPIPRRSHTFSDGVLDTRKPPRASASPKGHVNTTTSAAMNHRPPKSPARKRSTGSPDSLNGNSQDGIHAPAQIDFKCSPTSLTAAAKAISDRQGTEGGVNLQAFQGFPTKNGLSGCGTRALRRALSNIEHLVGRTQDNLPLLTALTQTNITSGIPITDLSEAAGMEPKQIVRVHSSPAVLAMGLPRKGSLLTSPPFQIGKGNTVPLFCRNTCGNYPSSRGKSPPLSSSPSALPTIPGSPTKTSHSKDNTADINTEMKPLRGLFTVGSSSPVSGDSIVAFGEKEHGGQKPAVVNSESKVTRGFGGSSPPKNQDVMAANETEASSPDMEGPIALIAPELPEDTLMDTEHTDGVRKLNFVLCLVEAIREVISSRGTPLTILTDSVAIKQNESFLADQIGLKSEELRKVEQLVLYVKALRALNLSLLFAQEEIRMGHLKPSNSVKNVLNDLNNHYHHCLEKASQLKQTIEPSLQTLDGKAMTISADRLMYHYAMELCQNAALDELFGNLRECKKKYETAQFLLQGLEGEAHNEEDRHLLKKYNSAVDKRLECLTKGRSRKSSQVCPNRVSQKAHQCRRLSPVSVV